MREHQPNPAVAKALRDFLDWAVRRDGGNDGANLAPGFTQLPPQVEKLSRAQIQKIQ